MRRSGLVMAVGLAGLGLASCGGGSGSAGTAGGPPKSQVVTAAYADTVAAGTARVSGNVKVQTAGRTLDITADGVADFIHHSAQMTASGPTGNAEFRIVNGTAYEQLPGQAWHQVPLPSVATGSAPADPGSFLGWLQGASGGVVRIGSQDIRGVATTEYQAHVDMERLAKDPAQAAQAKQLADLLGTSTVPIRLWVDAHRLARQMEIDFASQPGSRAAGQGGISFDIVMDFYDFGTSVSVAPPT